MRRCATTGESELTKEERRSLLLHLKKGNFEGRHLEIGTAAGGTLAQLLKTYERKEKQPSFVVVDPMTYFPNQLEKVKENIRKQNQNPDGVDFRVCVSSEAYPRSEKEKERFDWIFIDGSHKCPYVTQDLRWASLLNKNGLLCLHDYSPTHPGVYWSVNHFLKKNPHYEVVAKVQRLLILRKLKEGKKREVSSWSLKWSYVMGVWQQLCLSTKKRFREWLGS